MFYKLLYSDILSLSCSHIVDLTLAGFQFVSCVYVLHASAREEALTWLLSVASRLSWWDYESGSTALTAAR